VPTEVRLYDRLFTVPEPAATEDFRQHVNPHSLETVTAVVEPALAAAQTGDYYQFERLGYFVPDSKDSTPGRPVFNRTVSLKDAWTPKPPARA
jgi:glutaminyl-tRNA synthetase